MELWEGSMAIVVSKVFQEWAGMVLVTVKSEEVMV
jgi:hypothetical protein